MSKWLVVKTRLLALTALSGTVLVLAGPADAAVCNAQGVVRLAASDSGRSVDVRSGQTVIVSLQALPGKTHGSSNRSVVKPGAVSEGALIAGKDQFTFKATGRGQAQVSIHRLLPVGLPSGLSRTAGTEWVATVKVGR